MSDGPYASQDRRAVMAVGPLDRRGERSHRYVIGRHSALRVLLRAHGLEAWLMPPPATADDPTLGLVADTAAVMMLRRRRTLDRLSGRSAVGTAGPRRCNNGGRRGGRDLGVGCGGVGQFQAAAAREVGGAEPLDRIGE